MSIKLTDRITSYAALSNYKLLAKLPVIITINGRSFSKTTSLLDKPYSAKFMEALCATATRLIQDIDGSIFAYIFNDEIVIVVRNDQHLDTMPWCDNDIQKIGSTVASIATLFFNNYAASIELDLTDATFATNIFVVPNVTEAINVIIAKQQQNSQSSVQMACTYELLKKGHNKNDIKEIINGSNVDKIDFLMQECGVAFNDYPSAYRRGVACYKTPQVIKYEGQEIIKHKWHLDVNLPIFAGGHMLQDILKKENT